MGQKLKFDLSRQLLLEYQNATSKSAWTKCAHRVFAETIVEKIRIDTCTPFKPFNCKLFLQTIGLQRAPTATLKHKTSALASCTGTLKFGQYVKYALITSQKY